MRRELECFQADSSSSAGLFISSSSWRRDDDEEPSGVGEIKAGDQKLTPEAPQTWGQTHSVCSVCVCGGGGGQPRRHVIFKKSGLCEKLPELPEPER